MKELKHKNLYYVGGVVRDEFLGVQNLDTDYCYEGNAIEFAKDLNVIKINEKFGTVRVLLNEKEIDIASTREETYPKPGHLPLVKNIGCSLTEDLKRRDFTINAMAKNTLTGKLYDPFGGKYDIENKQLKILHENSFIDDPTRIVRALKFSVRFGFDLEPETLKKQREYLSNINYDMSYHRLKKELIETFNLNRVEVFDKFVNEGIYKLLGDKNRKKPDIKGVQIEKAVKSADFEPWIIYLSFFDISNLPLTRSENRIIEWVERLKNQQPNNNTPPESILIHNLMKENQ